MSHSEAQRPVAIVTGGSRGIGRAIVQRLAHQGVEVHFTYVRRPDAADELVETQQSAGKPVFASCADSSDMAAVGRVVERVIEERGRLDLLVNNAAITRDRLLARMSDEEWTSVLGTSLNGLFGASRAAAKQMMRQRQGRIVNITSVSGVIGMVGQTNYCAAKSAIIGFTRSLAKELAAYGVSVNAVAPGFVDTDMLASFTLEQKAAAVQRVPMKRFGTPEEIADVVAYLGLTAPSYLTGQTLVIDGGLVC